MDLIEFLRARLDEDEAVARAATEGPWNARTLGRHDGGAVVRSQATIGIHGARASADALHIARWDPARVLAEVEAKREIIRMFEVREEQSYLPGAGVVACHATGLLLAIRQFVRSYADHADFNPAWVAA